MSTQVEALSQRRSLSRLLSWLTALAIPSVFVFLNHTHDWSAPKTALVAIVMAIVFRALAEWLLHKALPKASLFGVEDETLKRSDVLVRRRAWFWRFWVKLGVVYGLLTGVVALHSGASFDHELVHLLPSILSGAANPSVLLQSVEVIFLFAANFLIFMGPLLAMGISQIKVFEPGDASWGVSLDDVRGQDAAKEEIRRVVQIWQYGDEFEKAGGKRPRGLLFLGPAGVGKTLMAKAIATGFGSPFIVMPGSAFASTFIGVDSILVRVLNRKAKKAAKKWGGTSIVFIDEIDAVGRRRSSLGGGGMLGGMAGGLGGMGMGQMALNQLLVSMDSIDSPPAFRMWLVKKLNLLLDAVYIVPEKVGPLKLRIPPLKSGNNNVYWVGATNVDLEALDPALTRAGRMGRHIFFRSPTLHAREQIFDLYLGKVTHESDLDSPERRNEIARVAQGLSPADIEQMCSMALTAAQHDGRMEVRFSDLVEALTTLEAGVAVGLEYTEAEARATAIHEAGHAAAAHIYRPEMASSRLSIRARGQSLGHHQSFEKEERFSKFRKEEFGSLVHGLAAMAAEYVFYGENTRGVSGDLDMVTSQVATMVGISGMTPYFTDAEDFTWERERFEQIGQRLLNRTHDQGQMKDGIGSVLGSPAKSKAAAQFLGHAFVTAWNFVYLNKDKVEVIAETLLEKQEIFGNDLVKLLDEQDLQPFKYDDVSTFWHREAWPVMG